MVVLITFHIQYIHINIINAFFVITPILALLHLKQDTLYLEVFLNKYGENISYVHGNKIHLVTFYMKNYKTTLYL